MKAIYLVLILGLLFSCPAVAQVPTSKERRPFARPEPQVDLRVELLSLVFRLAGREEYGGNHYPRYVDAVEEHFAPYKDHPLIQFARQLGEARISHDAVMFMAVHLQPPPVLSPVRPFRERLPEPRWTVKEADRFVHLLQRFYKDAHCAAFFEAQAPLFRQLEERFRPALDRFRFDWYPAFFGRMPEAPFRLVVSAGNSGGHYGPRGPLPEGGEALYAILALVQTDSTGAPVYDPETTGLTTAHEFNHSFVNPMNERHWARLEQSAAALLAAESPYLPPYYRHAKTVLDEALVRAVVLRYLAAAGTDSLQLLRYTNAERRRGFHWMPELVALLHSYERERTRYPDLESFMPRIAALYDSLPGRVDELRRRFEEARPVVTRLEPFGNKVSGVDTAITEIKIHFSKPLREGQYSIHTTEDTAAAIPITGIEGYSNGGRTLTLRVRLEKEKRYGFLLRSQRFETPDGLPLVEYEVSFNTLKTP